GSRTPTTSAASRLRTRTSSSTRPRRTPPSPAGKDGVNAAHAVGERRRAGLQDLGGLDLVQLAVAHGRYGVPARPRRDALGAELLAAPGTQDHVGALLPHRAGIRDHATARGVGKRKLCKNVFAAGDADELAHPADGADHRLVPFLEIDFGFS